VLRYEGSQSESVLTNAMQVCVLVDSQFCCLQGGAVSTPVPHPLDSRNIRCLWAACRARGGRRRGTGCLCMFHHFMIRTEDGLDRVVGESQPPIRF
jgi:hypothetical protein